MATDLIKLLERTFIGDRVTDAAGELLGTVVQEGACWVLVERKVETAEFEAMGLGWIRLRQVKLPPVESAESASRVPEEQSKPRNAEPAEPANSAA
jgi:hypothetical protein